MNTRIREAKGKPSGRDLIAFLAKSDAKMKVTDLDFSVPSFFIAEELAREMASSHPEEIPEALIYRFPYSRFFVASDHYIWFVKHDPEKTTVWAFITMEDGCADGRFGLVTTFCMKPEGIYINERKSLLSIYKVNIDYFCSLLAMINHPASVHTKTQHQEYTRLVNKKNRKVRIPETHVVTIDMDRVRAEQKYALHGEGGAKSPHDRRGHSVTRYRGTPKEKTFWRKPAKIHGGSKIPPAYTIE